MTRLFLTIDTELSVALHQRGVSLEDNFRTSILGTVSDGEWGIGRQLARLDAHGLKAVFFVEALCAKVFGVDCLRRIIDPILAAGHEVQLHLHTEWLPYMARNPFFPGRTGWCMADFGRGEQMVLMELGVEALTTAGAPAPSAFRAGNFGANNDTLRAGAKLGLTYDTSYNAAYLSTACRISANEAPQDATLIDGMIELPVTTFRDFGSHQRPAQLCAASISELAFVVDQSLAQGRRTIVLVSHSFELINRARTRANRLLVRRFEALCAMLAARRPQIETAVFASLDAGAVCPTEKQAQPLRSQPVRTVFRMAEQAWGTLIYEH